MSRGLYSILENTPHKKFENSASADKKRIKRKKKTEENERKVTKWQNKSIVS